MKTSRIIFWIVTGILSAFMILSAFLYLSSNPEIVNSMREAGFPGYFIPLLGIAKLLGAIALLVPGFPKVREWAYAGFTFTFIGAIWTHIATGTPFIAPVVALILLAVSYLMLRKIQADPVIQPA